METPRPTTSTTIPTDFGVEGSGSAAPNNDFHTDPGEFTGPLPWPQRPAPSASPLDVAEFVAIVITNVSPDQPFDPDYIAPHLADPLADEFRLATQPHEPTSTQSTPIDSRIVADTATSHQVQAVILLERTTGLGAVADPGFEHVQVELDLILSTERGWLVTDLRYWTQ